MNEPRLCLYYRKEPERNRWLPGDRFIRPAVRRLVRGKSRMGGVGKVFVNLCLGLDRLGVPYSVNKPFNQLKADDQVGVLGRGRYSLQGYDRDNFIVAGIGLMTHPAEWPTLCEEYPIARYLQHSEWVNNIFKPYFGKRCAIWPVGIDTQRWLPVGDKKDLDVLLYNKVMWDCSRRERNLVQPIRNILQKNKLSYAEISYGSYEESDYLELLARSKAMIFLCEHESQGLAYQECLSCDVPVLAWDQGKWLDPNRFEWETPEIPATSVPYFSAACGEKFKDIEEFEDQLEYFLARLSRHEYHPRNYMLENLTLEKSAQDFLDIMRRSVGEIVNK